MNSERLNFQIDNGVVLAYSDAHNWPGIRTTAFRGLLKVTKLLKPKAIVANGDILDGCAISRHARIGWEERPSVAEELKASQDRQTEIAKLQYGDLFWLRGNHDIRFETYLSNNAGEFEGVHGFKLSDHFPLWHFGTTLLVNKNTLFKHRSKGGRGANATYNNVKELGISIVTGHLHSPKTTPYTNATGTHYGVDLGTLADPNGPQFGYTECEVMDWRSAFGVFTYHNGLLLPPEHVQVIDEEHGLIAFRGQVMEV